MRRLLRDVGVNLIANLLPAAIIYLSGVLLGLFPPNTAGVTSALVVLGLAAVSLSDFVAQAGLLRRDRRRDERLLAINSSVIVVLGVVAAVAATGALRLMAVLLGAASALALIVSGAMGAPTPDETPPASTRSVARRPGARAT